MARDQERHCNISCCVNNRNSPLKLARYLQGSCVIQRGKVVVWQIYVHWETAKYNTILRPKEATLEARGFEQKVSFPCVPRALIQAAVRYDSRRT